MSARIALVSLLLTAGLLSGCGGQPDPEHPEPMRLIPTETQTPGEPPATQTPAELTASRPAHRTIQLNPDHPTYTRAEDLLADARVVAMGQVTAARTQAPARRSEMPHWHYTVRVQRVIRGRLTVGRHIVVVVPGGEGLRFSWVLVGGPQVQPGGRYLLYLTGPVDGKYYPLAGGHAIASPQNGGYVLPVGVSGGEPLRVSADAGPTK